MSVGVQTGYVVQKMEKIWTMNNITLNDTVNTFQSL